MVVVFNEQIKILAELQKIDAEIYQLKKELSAHPAIQQKIDAEFEKKRAGIKAAEEEFKKFQMKQKEKEGDLLSKEDKIKKLQAQLYQLKSNKEYAAMDLEIKGLKADKSVLEEEILKFLDSADQVKSTFEKEKELVAGEEKKAKVEIEALKKKTEEIGAVIQAHEEKRKGYLPSIDPKLISQYERILAKREGLALVPVRNNSCGGCHLELPPQAVHEIRLQDKLIMCESCARILYWPS